MYRDSKKSQKSLKIVLSRRDFISKNDWIWFAMFACPFQPRISSKTQCLCAPTKSETSKIEKWRDNLFRQRRRGEVAKRWIIGSLGTLGRAKGRSDCCALGSCRMRIGALPSDPPLPENNIIMAGLLTTDTAAASRTWPGCCLGGEGL